MPQTKLPARNDVTGDYIRSKPAKNSLYQQGWDRIFGNKNEEPNEEVKPEAEETAPKE